MNGSWPTSFALINFSRGATRPAAELNKGFAVLVFKRLLLSRVFHRTFDLHWLPSEARHFASHKFEDFPSLNQRSFEKSSDNWLPFFFLISRDRISILIFKNIDESSKRISASYSGSCFIVIVYAVRFSIGPAKNSDKSNIKAPISRRLQRVPNYTAPLISISLEQSRRGEKQIVIALITLSKRDRNRFTCTIINFTF